MGGCIFHYYAFLQEPGIILKKMSFKCVNSLQCTGIYLNTRELFTRWEEDSGSLSCCGQRGVGRLARVMEGSGQVGMTIHWEGMFTYMPVGGQLRTASLPLQIIESRSKIYKFGTSAYETCFVMIL